MKLFLIVLSLLLPSCLASLSLQEKLANFKVDHGKGCPEYNLFAQKVEASQQQCGDAPESGGVVDCELREFIAREADWFQCVFSPEDIGWVAPDIDWVIWSSIGADFEDFQVNNELDGAAKECERSSFEISEDQVEAVAMVLVGLDPSTAGEQEACWEDGIAIKEVKVLIGTLCAAGKFNDGINSQCSGQ